MYRRVGLAAILFGLLANPFLLGILFSKKGYVVAETQIKIALLEALVIVAGGLLALDWRKFLAVAKFAGLFLIWIGVGEGLFYTLGRIRALGVTADRSSGGEGLFTLDEDLGYKPTPGYKAKVTGSKGNFSLTVNYSIDTLGRRSTPLAPAEGMLKHLVFFGSSFVFGQYVNDAETLPYYTARRMPGYRPYNYGFYGYGPQQALALLQSGRIVREVPEKNGAAIYVFVDTDIAVALGSLRVYNSWAKDFPNYERDSGVLRRRGSFTTGRPLRALLYPFLKPSQMLSFFNFDFPSDKTLTEDNLETAFSILTESAKVAATDFPSGKFRVLIFPGTHKFNARLIGFLAAAHVPVLDYSRLFERTDSPYWNPVDGHPTALAYQTVGLRLAADLATDGSARDLAGQPAAP